LVIPLKTGFESDGCRYIHDDPAIAFVTPPFQKFYQASKRRLVYE
jgi:hypothetical protein